MNEQNKEQSVVPYGSAEALQLHQLRLLEWAATTGQKRRKGKEQDEAQVDSRMPSRWELMKGVQPYAWQHDCIQRWFEAGHRGTVKVVTGGGKTLLALAIAQKLQNEQVKNLRLAVVVPTIVLMHQWYDEILEHGNIPPEAIGRMGGGYQDDFGGGRRVLIAVLASARRGLPKVVKRARAGKYLLLVADECHRSGAKDMSQVFATERSYSLGLSATPERDDDGDEGYDESLLGQELGAIIYEFNLADALREGLVPSFTVRHFGLHMQPDERSRYDALSRSISDSLSALRAEAGAKGTAEGSIFAWAQRAASRRKGRLGSIARSFLSDTSRRKELLNRLDARGCAVETLIALEFEFNPKARIILFHESIDEVMNLFLRLHKQQYPVIAEHSELPGSVRETGLDLFRRGIAQIIVSARSLIEGFNVPATDVGIIVASSGSVRQRIQSLGRVLRRHRGPTGEEKTSCIHVLYAADSVEEGIYGKLDWDTTTGIDRNQYYLWAPPGQPAEQDGPPRTPLPTDTQVDPVGLSPGCEYPGRYEGVELTCDSQQNVRNAEGQYVQDSADLALALLRIKGSAGRFRVTARQRYVLIRVSNGTEWSTRYVTRLAGPVQFIAATPDDVSMDLDPAAWAQHATLGNPYPFPNLAMTHDGLTFKSRKGGVVSRRIPGGEVYARTPERAHDRDKGADAQHLVAALQKLKSMGRTVCKIMVNEANHVVYREAGRLFFVCALSTGLEFPED